MLGDAEILVWSPEAELPSLILPVVVEEISDAPEPESPPLILPVVVEDSSIAPVEELIELVPSALGSSLPPPPGFSPFSWPVNDGGTTNCAQELVWTVRRRCRRLTVCVQTFRRGWEC